MKNWKKNPNQIRFLLLAIASMHILVMVFSHSHPLYRFNLWHKKKWRNIIRCNSKIKYGSGVNWIFHLDVATPGACNFQFQKVFGTWPSFFIHESFTLELESDFSFFFFSLSLFSSSLFLHFFFIFFVFFALSSS